MENGKGGQEDSTKIINYKLKTEGTKQANQPLH